MTPHERWAFRSGAVTGFLGCLIGILLAMWMGWLR